MWFISSRAAVSLSYACVVNPTHNPIANEQVSQSTKIAYFGQQFQFCDIAVTFTGALVLCEETITFHSLINTRVAVMIKFFNNVIYLPCIRSCISHERIQQLSATLANKIAEKFHFFLVHMKHKLVPPGLPCPRRITGVQAQSLRWLSLAHPLRQSHCCKTPWFALVSQATATATMLNSVPFTRTKTTEFSVAYPNNWVVRFIKTTSAHVAHILCMFTSGATPNTSVLQQ